MATPRYLVPEWTFGIQEEHLQATIDEARGRGATADELRLVRMFDPRRYFLGEA